MRLTPFELPKYSPLGRACLFLFPVLVIKSVSLLRESRRLEKNLKERMPATEASGSGSETNSISRCPELAAEVGSLTERHPINASRDACALSNDRVQGTRFFLLCALVAQVSEIYSARKSVSHSCSCSHTMHVCCMYAW
jgi:hypothetical protein